MAEFVVFVGSTNGYKVGAVKLVLKEIFSGKSIDIVGIDAGSGVNEQPVGNDETLKGALHRLEDIERKIGDQKFDLLVAMENGIIPVEIHNQIHYFDLGWVVVKDAHEMKAIASSTGIEFDQKNVLEGRRRGFAATTVGLVIAEETGCDPRDPHSFLTQGLVSRADMLQQAFKAGLGQLARISHSSLFVT